MPGEFVYSDDFEDGHEIQGAFIAADRWKGGHSGEGGTGMGGSDLSVVFPVFISAVAKFVRQGQSYWCFGGRFELT